ncbi:MAG: hypothetical protein M1830_003041 [Pleopsidium flavum]|nr:MAG: hypothetical protein M1830_003041 [Pleopsidium flavum]
MMVVMTLSLEMDCAFGLATEDVITGPAANELGLGIEKPAVEEAEIRLLDTESAIKLGEVVAGPATDKLELTKAEDAKGLETSETYEDVETELRAFAKVDGTMLLIISERFDAVMGRMDSLLDADTLVSLLDELELASCVEPGGPMLLVAVGSTEPKTELEKAECNAVGTGWPSVVVMLFDPLKGLYIDADPETDLITALELPREVEDSALVDSALLESELGKELTDTMLVYDVMPELAPFIEESKLVDVMVLGLELVCAILELELSWMPEETMLLDDAMLVLELAGEAEDTKLVDDDEMPIDASTMVDEVLIKD